MPTPLSRRSLLRFTGAAAALGMASPFLPACTTPEPTEPANGPAPSDLALEGDLVTTERNGVRVYTYVSPASSNHVTSHIIEAETGLVVVDAQFQVPYAQELKRILSGMEKPVERVVISHAHPDHFYGLSVAFEDVPIYALAATQDAIATTGQGMLDGQRQQMGQLLPETVLAPTQTLTEGAMTIDGLDFEFERVEDAEAPEQVIVRLPSAGIHIVQDLAYNQVHLFTGNDTIDSWMGVLSGMTDLDGAVLVGHGRPTTAAVFQQDIEYLRQTIDARTEAGTPEAFMNAMREAYPGWPGDALLGFSAAMLYAR